MIDILKPLIKRFMPFAKEKMGFSRPPKLFLRQDEQNAADPMGKTGFYDPEKESITLYITGRHPKDIMRSLAHELQHHTQKCNGDFENVQNMGEEGYAQTNPHMRTMEIEAYQASIVFRDWEDSCKGTTYYEHLQKGDKSSMSTKNWKNQELNGLLMERFGFEFKPLIENLEEYATAKKSDKKGKDAEKSYGEQREACADKNPQGQPESEWMWRWDEQRQKCLRPSQATPKEPESKKEEKVDESFQKPKSASGSGPSNKGGKIDRSDVANKDTSKFGQGGSKGGGKPSASGTNAPSKGGKIDRSDVANKATGRWLKEEEELDEMCPAKTPEEAEGSVMVIGDRGDDEMAGEPGEEDLQALAGDLLSVSQRIADALGGSMSGGEEEEELEERRGRGRKGPHIRGPEDPRLRENIAKLRKAGYSTGQIKEFLINAYSRVLKG